MANLRQRYVISFVVFVVLAEVMHDKKLRGSIIWSAICFRRNVTQAKLQVWQFVDCICVS